MKKIKYGHTGYLALVSLLLAVENIIGGISIYLLRFITDYGLNGELDRMIGIAKIMIVLLIVLLFISLFTTSIKAIYMEQSLILMKNRYVHELLKQDITQLQKEHAIHYRSHLSNDFDNYEKKYMHNLLEIISMMMQFVVTIVLVATISWILVVIALILFVIFIGISSSSNKPVQKSEAKKSVSLSAYTELVEESLEGFEIIKQHQLEASRFEVFKAKAKQVQVDNFKVDLKSTYMHGFVQTIQISILFGLIISGILAAKAYQMSLGSIIVVASGFGSVMWPLQNFSSYLIEMKGIENILDRFDQYLKRPSINRHRSLSTFNSLHFEHCDLGYPEDDFAILYDVNFTVKQHEKILIIGPSGAGKSTILKTLRQSLIPKAGQVLVNDESIYEIIPMDYYALFASVDQIGFIFNGSIMDNVTLYKDIDPELVTEALKRVNLGDLKLDYVLHNNGSNISGGQRARLLLARSQVLQSEIILCDEIFANLDLKVAQHIEADMLKLDQTIINVSHVMFKENLHHYDKVYIVENQSLKLAQDFDEVIKKMSLSSSH